MAIETPSYSSLKKEGKFELRDYEAHIVAMVELKAESLNQASNDGFQILAGYIFGNNTKKVDISMTAPVEVERLPGSEKIPMTAPVNVESVRENTYAISFAMPRKYDLPSLPRPNDKRVSLKQVPEHRAAVIRFSGFVNEKTFEKRSGELREWLAKEKLKARGGFITARYNPPWIPWFMRRNEIIVRVS